MARSGGRQGRKHGAYGFKRLQLHDALSIVYNELGGGPGLLAWARSEPYRLDIFYRDMLMKLLPLQVESHTTITHEQALDELERRFPRFIDGKPVNYAPRLKAPHVDPE
jgi:hypothetical protein